MVPFGSPKAYHLKKLEAVREPAKLFYGSKYSLDFKYSRNDTFLTQKHHY